jgi:D-3-phosphoglycerate dehydrogenase / 2-oxoglutarate reductase
MRLLIADKLHPKAIEELRSLPIEVEYEPEIGKDALVKRLKGIGILVVRSTEVTEEALDAARELNLIVRAGPTYETIDVRAASKRGIYVSNCPGKNASAVAELVYGLLIAIDRRIVDAMTSLRNGRFERAEFGRAEGLVGKTLGIAGLGAIGRDVAARAKAFGLHPLAWSRSLTASRAAELGVGYTSSLSTSSPTSRAERRPTRTRCFPRRAAMWASSTVRRTFRPLRTKRSSRWPWKPCVSSVLFSSRESFPTS